MKLVITEHLIACAEGKVQVSDQTMGILIDGAVIRKVAPLAEIEERNQPGLEVIDVGGQYVIPGLIDGHLHLSFSSSEQPLHELYGDDDSEVLLRMVKAMELELRSGVTTVRDCGARGMSVLKLRDFVRKGILQGTDIISAGMPITITGGHCNFCGLEADTKDDVVKAVRMLCKEDVDYIKVMVSGGNMTPGSNSLIDQYDQEMLSAIVAEAHQRGKKVSGHVHSVAGIRRAVAAGFDTLEHCSFKVADGEAYDPELAEQMKAAGIAVNPAMGKAYILPPELAAPLPDKVAMWADFQKSRFSTTERMYRAGVRIFAGTDAGCKNTKFDEFYLTLDLLEKKVHMSKEDVLLSATVYAAEALGIETWAGSIEAGKQADLVCVAENPLESFLHLKQVTMVLKKGERVAI